jgi:hypothetical protein
MGRPVGSGVVSHMGWVFNLNSMYYQEGISKGTNSITPKSTERGPFSLCESSD